MMTYPDTIIENNTAVSDIPAKVVYNPYTATHENFLAVRMRGTRIEKTSEGYHVAAWQRNMAQIQKMYSSLPTVITMTLDHERTIQTVQLAPEFTGSQGITCSQAYFNRHLNQILPGNKLTPENVGLFLAKQTHCYHVQEVLLALLTFFAHFDLLDVPQYDEIETGETFAIGNDILCAGTQRFSDGNLFQFEMCFHGLKNKMKFKQDGTIARIDNVAVDFKSSGEPVIQGVLTGDDTNSCYQSIISFFETVVKHVGNKTYPVKDVMPHHTTLQPHSFLGLMVQLVAIAQYPENYNYVQHAIRGLQRKKEKPYCLGVIKDLEEGKRFYPSLVMDDLY